jgi:hypothetical protein
MGTNHKINDSAATLLLSFSAVNIFLPPYDDRPFFTAENKRSRGNRRVLKQEYEIKTPADQCYPHPDGADK